MTITIGALLMVKDEEETIAMTIQSVYQYVNHILIYDTGSKDNTIPIIQNVCRKNNKPFTIKYGVFTTFPQSRNDALEFAETFPLDFLLLMDAGDEFQTTMEKNQFDLFLQKNCLADCYLISQEWLTDQQRSTHYDVRLIRNKKGLRYDLSFPVHEKFKNVSIPVHTLPSSCIVLYQNRDLYGKKSMDRYHRDIEILLRSTPNRRNYFFLAQSYMSVQDFENGFLYNKKYLELPLEEDIDERIVYTRIAYCAMMCKKEPTEIIPVLQKVIEKYKPPFIDAFIYLFKYCIENNKPLIVIPYVKLLFNLKKETGMISHHFYDYVRWHYISIICLMTNQYLDLGYDALKKIISFKKPNDLHNYNIYKKLLT